MTNRENIENFCAALQFQMSFSTEKHTVEFIDRHLNLTASNGVIEYVAEIRVDQLLVFRESSAYSIDQDPMIIEDKTLWRLLSSVFNYGVMSSKNLIEERNKNYRESLGKFGAEPQKP
jgi:hypothetical protein